MAAAGEGAAFVPRTLRMCSGLPLANGFTNSLVLFGFDRYKGGDHPAYYLPHQGGALRVAGESLAQDTWVYYFEVGGRGLRCGACRVRR